MKTILTVGISLLTLLIPVTTIADNKEYYKMPTVYISSSRLPESIDFAGNQVTVIDSTEIAQMGASTIAEILNFSSSTHSHARGPLGVQTDVEMNGSTFSQVLILIDGLRINDPQTGHHNLNLPIRPQDLERIEINHGAGSGIHGPDAFGGVINLVTRQDIRKNVNIASHYGSRQNGNDDVSGVATSTRISHGLQSRWGNFNVSAGREQSDGYRDTTELHAHYLSARMLIPVSNGTLKFSAGIEEKSFGANDFYGDWPSKEWTTAGIYTAQFEQKNDRGKRLVSNLIYRRHRDRFLLSGLNPDGYDARHLTQLATISTFIESSLGSGNLVIGGELNGEEIESNKLGNHRQSRIGGFSEWAVFLGDFRINLRNRIDFSSVYRTEWAPGMRVNRSYFNSDIFVGVHRTFRAPGFTELHNPSPSNQGNRNLEPERAWAYEFGSLSKVTPRIRLKFKSYLRMERNVIDWTRPETGDKTNTLPWNAQNLGEMQSKGSTIETTYEDNDFNLSVAYSIHNKSRKLPSGIMSKYVFTQPRHQFDWRIRLPLFARMKALWHYQYRNYSYKKSHGIGHVVLTRKMDMGSLHFKIRNITNTRYEYFTGIPMPSRWFSIETTLKL